MIEPIAVRLGRFLTVRLLCALTLASGALSLPAGAAAAEGAFEIRGVAMGFYGSIWSHADRMDMIRWLAAHGMNTFAYLPQEDVYTRERWREPFPEDIMAQFAEEIRLARALGVRWAIGIRPGRPLFPDDPRREICFSCPADFELLAAKYQSFHDLGVRLFRINFDDGVRASSHPEDVNAYGADEAAYGRMNADLANRLQARFPDSLVIFAGADYSGTKPTEYLAAVRETLSPNIPVVWTGPDVGSREITAKDADAFAAAVTPENGPRRRLVIVDNYPVNDVNGEAYSVAAPVRERNPGAPERPPSLRLNLGPLKGRGADLVGRVDGFLANAMNQPHASKLALYTLAAYLNDPLAYTPDAVTCSYNPDEHTRAGCLAEREWRRGVRELGGVAAGELLNVANQMRSNRFDRTESPVFVAHRDALKAAFGGTRWHGPWSALVDELEAERDAGRMLREGHLPSPEFVEETANHLRTLDLNTDAGLRAAEMLAAQRPDFESVSIERHALSARVSGRALRADPALVAQRQAGLAPVEAEARSSPFSVHGDRVDVFEAILSGSVFLLENRMDQFLDWAHQTTATWLPLAPRAAAGPLKVTVNGEIVSVAPEGRFSTVTELAPGQRSIDLMVTDGAGFSTARTYRAG